MQDLDAAIRACKEAVAVSLNNWRPDCSGYLAARCAALGVADLDAAIRAVEQRWPHRKVTPTASHTTSSWSTQNARGTTGGPPSEPDDAISVTSPEQESPEQGASPKP